MPSHNGKSRPGRGGSERQVTDDRLANSTASATAQRHPAVVITPGIFRGFDVGIDPPVATHQARHFGSHAEAVAFADELSSIEGWPLVDKAEALS